VSSDSTVNYDDDTTPPWLSEIDSNFTTFHSITLSSLDPDTLYYYEVASFDGNITATLPGNGTYYEFTTLEKRPTISGVSVMNVTNTSATIVWTTDVSSTSTVNYGNTTPPLLTQSDYDLVTSHSITLVGLTPSMLYYFEVSSMNIDGLIQTSDNGGSYYDFTTSKTVELEGWGWCTNRNKVVPITFEGYTSMVERTGAPNSYSMHTLGSLTLPSPYNETVSLDMYGSRVRSMFYLRQEVTGKSVNFHGTWLDAGGNQSYIGMTGAVALPNPEGEILQTTRVCFVMLRTPDVEVPLAQPGSFAENVDSMLTRFVKLVDKVLDGLIGTGFSEILSNILVKISVLLAHLKAMGTTYIP